MKISIVVPTFNQAAFIAETLRSILQQSHRPLQVIVVDGASTDNTVEILEAMAQQHPELEWMSEPDNGPADAVNKGLALATGDVCGIQSSDDLYHPGALTAVANAFLADPALKMVFSDVDVIDQDGSFIRHGPVPEFSWESWFAIAFCVPQSSIFFNTKLAQELGGWRTEFFGCDLDLWLRMALRSEPRKLPMTLSSWRVYEGQRTQPEHFAKILDGYQRMIAESEELPKASLQVQRLARASVYIAMLYFDPAAPMSTKRIRALQALQLHPSFPLYQKSRILRPLIPGYKRSAAVLRPALHQIKKLLKAVR